MHICCRNVNLWTVQSISPCDKCWWRDPKQTLGTTLENFDPVLLHTSPDVPDHNKCFKLYDAVWIHDVCFQMECSKIWWMEEINIKNERHYYLTRSLRSWILHWCFEIETHFELQSDDNQVMFAFLTAHFYTKWTASVPYKDAPSVWNLWGIHMQPINFAAHKSVCSKSTVAAI